MALSSNEIELKKKLFSNFIPFNNQRISPKYCTNNFAFSYVVFINLNHIFYFKHLLYNVTYFTV